MDGAQDTVRAHVRMRLAFWQAQDRRSISTGPSWLWRGNLLAPLRQADLSAPTAEMIARRRTAGVPRGALFYAAGPRQLCLPRWATLRSAARWAAAATGLGVIAVVCSRFTGDRIQVGVAAAWAGAGCVAVAAALGCAAAWGRRDPLKLTAAQRREIAAARRVLKWNPLAGDGPIAASAAYLLEGISVCDQLQASSAWALPGVDILRARVDPDEEIFQIARAAHSLDRLETDAAALAAHMQITGLAQAAIRHERHHLTDALLTRLTVLHRCVATLSDLEQRARNVAVDALDSAPVAALCGSTAENELAAVALADLNSDLTAIDEAYHDIGLLPASRATNV
jgi:hypothetical protein